MGFSIFKQLFEFWLKEPEIETENVDIQWPEYSGLQEKLKAEGYELRWVNKDNVSR